MSTKTVKPITTTRRTSTASARFSKCPEGYTSGHITGNEHISVREVNKRRDVSYLRIHAISAAYNYV
nr:MAG TPA: hypothetical protein [Bacteriophage sp.]